MPSVTELLTLKGKREKPSGRDFQKHGNEMTSRSSHRNTVAWGGVLLPLNSNPGFRGVLLQPGSTGLPACIPSSSLFFYFFFIFFSSSCCPLRVFFHPSLPPPPRSPSLLPPTALAHPPPPPPPLHYHTPLKSIARIKLLFISAP